MTWYVARTEKKAVQLSCYILDGTLCYHARPGMHEGA
jgi:hypothetical protein